MDLNDLTFRLLPENELDVAASLSPSETDKTDPRVESWGQMPRAPLAAGEKVWGLYSRSVVSGALAMKALPDGFCEVSALALPRGRWGMGLSTWMLEEAYKIARRGKFQEMRIVIDNGGAVLGDALIDAGFVGPDLMDENFPKGTWTRDITSRE